MFGQELYYGNSRSYLATAFCSKRGIVSPVLSSWIITDMHSTFPDSNQTVKNPYCWLHDLNVNILLVLLCCRPILWQRSFCKFLCGWKGVIMCRLDICSSTLANEAHRPNISQSCLAAIAWYISLAISPSVGCLFFFFWYNKHRVHDPLAWQVQRPHVEDPHCKLVGLENK